MGKLVHFDSEYPEYLVSPEGEVYSEKYGKFFRLKSVLVDGYPTVGLYIGGKTKKFQVHRLVAKAFIPNPENKPCVGHINGIRSDNRVENLRWCTNQENCSFPLARKNKSEAQKGKQLSEETKRKLSEALQKKPVQQLDKLTDKVIAAYPSTCEAARQTGVNQSSISKCCLGKPSFNSAGGFKWRYAE